MSFATAPKVLAVSYLPKRAMQDLTSTGRAPKYRGVGEACYWLSNTLTRKDMYTPSSWKRLMLAVILKYEINRFHLPDERGVFSFYTHK